MGLDASEVVKKYPIDKYSIINEDEDGYMNIDYVQLIAPMLTYIQELEARIIKLEKNNDI
jgi:hypothetical protein